uniref:Uncharacterized protein n=1 Tax=Pristionchus pacificus TaxID=54126 RepID=A0A2A6D2U6_PRIPA|eukprot:PDM84802.1 hypothetical protein PRIPAC_33825 [Pristionchus pacificus]
MIRAAKRSGDVGGCLSRIKLISRDDADASPGGELERRKVQLELVMPEWKLGDGGLLCSCCSYIRLEEGCVVCLGGEYLRVDHGDGHELRDERLGGSLLSPFFTIPSPHNLAPYSIIFTAFMAPVLREMTHAIISLYLSLSRWSDVIAPVAECCGLDRCLD